MLSLHIYISPSGRDEVQKTFLYDKPIDGLHNQVVKYQNPSVARGFIFYELIITSSDHRRIVTELTNLAV